MDASDPRQIVENLDAAAITRRIEDLHAEEKALMVLLRAARKRDRHLDQVREDAE